MKDTAVSEMVEQQSNIGESIGSMRERLVEQDPQDV